MQRRNLIICAGLIAIIGSGVWSARLIWQRQERTAIAIAGVATVPDLSRWPTELKQKISLASSAVTASSSPLEPLAKLATLYCANGYGAQAESALAALRQLDPKNARWPYLLADLRLRTGDATGAEAALQATVEHDASYAPAWLRLGELLAKRGALDRARDCYAQAFAVTPGMVRAEYGLIYFEAMHGGGDATRRKLEQLARTHPEIKDVHELLAGVLEAAKDSVGAARERRLATTNELVIGTEDPWLDEVTEDCFDSNRLMLRAVAMRREGRYAEAEKLLLKVVQLATPDPANPLGWELLSDLYVKMGKPAEARATLEKALTQFPDDPQMPLLLTRQLCTARQAEAAIPVIQRAVQRWPGRGDLQAALGLALQGTGNFAAAVPTLQQAIRLDPTLTEAQYTLGTCLLELGQRDAARAELEKTVTMRPDYPEALFALSAIELEAGDFNAAEPHVFKVYALDPDEPNAQQLVAAWHLLKGLNSVQSGNLDDADSHYRAGLAVAPEYALLLRETGSLAAKRGRWTEAVKADEHFLRVKPTDLAGHLSLGLALQKSGQAAEATAAFQRGLTLAQQAGDQARIDEFTARLNR